jgi:hypothetical protein
MFFPKNDPYQVIVLLILKCTHKQAAHPISVHLDNTVSYTLSLTKCGRRTTPPDDAAGRRRRTPPGDSISSPYIVWRAKNQPFKLICFVIRILAGGRGRRDVATTGSMCMLGRRSRVLAGGRGRRDVATTGSMFMLGRRSRLLAGGRGRRDVATTGVMCMLGRRVLAGGRGRRDGSVCIFGRTSCG